MEQKSSSTVLTASDGSVSLERLGMIITALVIAMLLTTALYHFEKTGLTQSNSCTKIILRPLKMG